LPERERGEDSAVEEYEKAMNNGLSSPAREIISRQYDEIKAHDPIRNLGDISKRAD
jgi:uncharacterized protein (TIGR02284 family)